MSSVDKIVKVIDRTYQGKSLLRIAQAILRDNAQLQAVNARMSPQDIDDIANLCELAEEFLEECYLELEDYKSLAQGGDA